ncbi:MAG: hypothetical protein WC523_06290 [Patescibacteria group bacterium]
MFADGFDQIGGLSNNQPEKKLSAWEFKLNFFKTAVKDQDWRSVINSLEDWPPVASLSVPEKEAAEKNLHKLRRLMAEAEESGRVFSGDSLEDLSEELERSLSAKEREFGL